MSFRSPQAADAELGGRWSSPIADASLCLASAGAIWESGCISQDGFEGLICRGHGQDLRASLRSTE